MPLGRRIEGQCPPSFYSSADCDFLLQVQDLVALVRKKPRPFPLLARWSECSLASDDTFLPKHGRPGERPNRSPPRSLPTTGPQTCAPIVTTW